MIGANIQQPSTGGGGISDGDKGDITVSASGATWTIDNGVVTNAKLADVATATIKGRTTAGTGSPEDLTSAQATALLDVFTTTLKGLAPASGGGTSNFLRADGTWAAPAGGSNEPADDVFRIVGSSDATKKIAFEADTNISTATTRTFTAPDRSGTMIVSDTTAVTGSDVVNNIVSLTQAEYDAIGSPDAATLYLITDP
jgi:hypothetical protein